MVVGPDVTFEFVLPYVNNFFDTFVQTYGAVPLDRPDFLRGLELAAELFVPLVQLVGAEAFYTAGILALYRPCVSR